METKHYRTLMRADHILYGNSFIEGRVSGVQAVVCNEIEKSYALEIWREGTVFQADCTEEQYATFKRVIQKMYPHPGLFEFDFKG